ncbi:MAG: ATP-dependent DNA helicase RecG [Candidatus Wildermuthbacteria bacterium]|nr:ATP-dependent DNA helicase RecG [Candidatus Wildermuthbacteria bacterium]
MDISTPIEQLPRVGPAYQKKLKRLGIKIVRDLLFHFPHRYDDFSNLIKIADLEEGGPAFAEASAGKPFCFQGEITGIRTFRAFRRKMMLTQATVEDETGKIKALWFNQPYLISTLKKGTFVCLAGKVRGKKSAKYISNPTYEKIQKPNLKIQNNDLTHTGRLVPVYPETEGLSSKWLRFIVKPLLEKLADNIPEYLPATIINKYEFLPITKALWQIHFPDSLNLAVEARKRFAFEELFQLSLFVLRERIKLAREKAAAIPINLPLIQEFVSSLPFKLTDAQKKSAWQILKDMEKPRPMNRLLEGDVGSGKTVVAAIAALNVVKAGYQVAFIAPTEILANQHFKTISAGLKNFNVRIGLLAGKKKILTEGIDILIGTHALLQDRVKFEKMALLVIDEQHRFGVEQRAKLCRQKEYIPHLLSMTATPIPRTLSLTIFGDLDLSVLDEMPKGRKKITTRIIQPKDKKETYDFIREQVREGRQVFVICPRIDPPKVNPEDVGKLLSQRELSWMDVKAVKQEHEKLSKDIFPDLKLGMLHGKLKSAEKEEAMKKFTNREIDILVSTSVVEVGVDIPNASVMVIEGSEKFGLAQLHQFRGRVGRAEHQSYCFLFTDTTGTIWNRRLKALINCENGFELAEKDLQIRGPGDFVGIRQWGLPDITMASLTDATLVSNARNEAKGILVEDPQLKKYPELLRRVKEFRERIHLE